MQLAERLRAAPRLRVRVWEPWGVLLPLVALQWLLLGAFVLTVRHNGWLFYQGGDETFFYTSSWVMAHGHIADAAIGWGWSYLLAPVAAIFGANYLTALPAVVLIQTVLLLPLGALAVYGIAARIGGRLVGYATTALWVIGPYAVIPLWDHRYHQKYVEQFLPQALGLTGLGDFPSMICLLCAAYFVVRALDERSLPDAALAGLLVGFAIGIKPANALFLAGAFLAFAAALRWRAGLVFAAALVPPLIALTLWKDKGLGNVPLLHSAAGGGAVAAAAIGPPLALSVHLSHYVKLDWHQLHLNLDALREFFWSVRVLEWVALAGFVGVLRRSLPKALLLGGWFGAFFLVKATSDRASIENGSLLRLFLPGFPPLLIMAAAIVLLVPTFGPRLAEGFPARAEPLRWRSRPLLAAAVLVGLLPAVLFLALPPLKDARAAKFFENNTYVPVTNGQVRLHAAPGPGGVELTWRTPPSTANVFYRVFRFKADYVYDYRLPHGINGVRCNPPTGGASDCHVEMDTLTVTRAHRFLDPAKVPPGRYAYRIGVMANWANDLAGGDVLFLSAPAVIDIGR